MKPLILPIQTAVVIQANALGMRKAKNFNINLVNIWTIPLQFTLVYVPQGTNIIQLQYSDSHAQYKDIFTTCCALVNFGIMFGNPLREEDYNYFSRFKAIVRREGMEEKTKLLQKKQKQKRISKSKKQLLLLSSSSNSLD